MIKVVVLASFVWILIGANLLFNSPAVAQSGQDEFLQLKNNVEKKLQELRIMADLLRSAAVVKEIEASPDQVSTLNQLIKSSVTQEMSHYNSLGEIGRNLSQLAKPNPSTENYQTTVAEVYKNSLDAFNRLDNQLDQVLLPSQIHRLRQLALQHGALVNNPYGSEVGLVYGLADTLGLNPAEKGELGKLTKKVQIEYFQRAEALQAELNAKFVESLSPDQRTKYMTLVGERFDKEKENRKFRAETAKSEGK